MRDIILTAIIVALGLATVAAAATGRTQCRCAACKTSVADIGPKIKAVIAELERVTGRVATITSGLRCGPHNKAVGGVAKSRHVTGKAVDLKIDGMSPAKVAAIARRIPGVRYVGVYKSHVHIDVE